MSRKLDLTDMSEKKKHDKRKERRDKKKKHRSSESESKNDVDDSPTQGSMLASILNRISLMLINF